MSGPQGTQMCDVGISYGRAIEELDLVVEHRDRVNELLTEKVIQARHAGASWEFLAATLGIDKQTAVRRYRSLSG